MTGKQTQYVIITPVRDEAEHIGATIDSVVAQTVTPQQWIIVDDGSTDGTLEIIERYAARHDWILAVSRQNRGFRNTNTGAIEAFYEGYPRLTCTSWEFLVNLDGDLGFEPTYFERCFEEFQKDPALGIGGGTLYHIQNGVEVTEIAPSFHVRGATKIYRRPCWERTGGILRGPGWDTLDEVKANMCGWHSRSFTQIRALHKRPTGAAEGSLRDAVKNGRAEYYCGYHPLFMLVKCVKRAGRKPYLIGGAGTLYGFLSSWIKGCPRVDDAGLIDYVGSQQMRRLFLLETIWK